MEPSWIINTEVFIHPFTCLVSGPSQSGKTTLINNILIHNKLLISPPPDKIIYCYSAWQPLYDDMKSTISDIEFNDGIIDLISTNANVNTLIVFDDLMTECENDKNILNLFTRDSHHKNISVFLISQNLFSKGKNARTISLNCNHLIIFRNPRDKSQIYVIARQMFPDKINFFMEAFTDATTTKNNSYIFIDLKQNTKDKNRIQTGITPGDLRIIYTPK